VWTENDEMTRAGSETRDFTSIAADMVSTDTEVRVRGAIDFLRIEARCDTFLLAYKTPEAKGFSRVNNVNNAGHVRVNQANKLEIAGSREIYGISWRAFRRRRTFTQ